MMDPSLILGGETPRIIDEWQEVPSIWDVVRHAVDQRGVKGQFILTGSSTPNRKDIFHSGAGRIATLRMRPMSLFEAGASSGKISLKDLFNKKIPSILTGEVSLQLLIEHILRGGWPESVGIDFELAQLVPLYIEAIINEDINRVDGGTRDLNKIRLLLRSLTRNESTTATNKKLKNDINVETVADYLHLFERLFLLDNQDPFSSNIRSSVRVKQSVKRHFCDPSLACALLGTTLESHTGDLKTLGFLFEALCERDLKIYAESNGGKLFHY